MMQLPDQIIIEKQVRDALIEDVGAGDISAQLIPQTNMAHAQIITREPAMMCGIAWANEVFKQVDLAIKAQWQVADGEVISANQLLCELKGPAHSLLTAERTALNFLQMLSGTATITSQYTQQIRNTKTKLLDTRKTIPGLRIAQKYAVRCGGGTNHRLGLYDAYLIKENHIMACGSISNAVQRARQQHPNKRIEVEVENLSQLKEAHALKVEMIMLDNFSLTMIKEAVALNAGQAKLEVSGNADNMNLSEIADTGVDFISLGALTKNIRAIDLSMRFVIS